MSSPFEPSAEATPSGRRLDFLPIALAFLRKLRVAEIIDEALPMPAPGPQSAIAAALGGFNGGNIPAANGVNVEGNGNI